MHKELFIKKRGEMSQKSISDSVVGWFIVKKDEDTAQGTQSEADLTAVVADHSL